MNPIRHGGLTMLLCVFLTGAVSPCAMAEKTSAALKQAEVCMLAVLKTVPNVKNARWEMRGGNGAENSVLAYETTGRAGHPITVRFSSLNPGPDGIPEFLVHLPGLSAPGTQPDDWGTGAVMRQWKARCAVNASGLFN